MTEKLVYATVHYAALAMFLLSCWGAGRWIVGRHAETGIRDFWLCQALSAAIGTGAFICALQLLAIAGLLLPPFIYALAVLGMLMAAVLALGSVALAEPLVATYLKTGEVPRFPTAILSTGMMISAFLSLVCGVLLRNVTLARQEAKRLVYLAIPSARKG